MGGNSNCEDYSICMHSLYDRLVDLVANRESYGEYSNATIVQDEEHIKAHKKFKYLEFIQVNEREIIFMNRRRLRDIAGMAG